MSRNVKPWHEVARLRPELREDNYSASFTANLYSVMRNEGQAIYRDPRPFFQMTYATDSIEELTKDVLQRLAGKTERAVHQLEKTYGGGKTHTLILLWHLAHDRNALPTDTQSLDNILARAKMGMNDLPRACVAAIPFDNLDMITGMETVAPNGERANFRLPWNVLAWQIGGREGLARIGSSVEEEREDAPYVNVLTDLFRLRTDNGEGVLILLDEVLMWGREFIGSDDDKLERLRNFFQRLAEAVKNTDRCCMVASLLANEVTKMDNRGRQIMEDLYGSLRRQGESGVTPIGKQDIAIVLRRRFFEPDSISNSETFRPSVLHSVQCIASLDDQTDRKMKEEIDRYMDSFPFHPDLIEVLYQKWTALETFQQARGVLKTFAAALRDAEGWDRSPLVGPSVFLNAPDKTHEGLSEAAQDLSNVARQQVIQDQNPDWPKIIEGELAKARTIQEVFEALKPSRIVEQAVFAIFLHSEPQPMEKVRTRELMALIGHNNPDKTYLQRGLERLARDSWFLDESTTQEGGSGSKQLPETWRYGFQPNLRAMHDSAQERVPSVDIEKELETEIQRLDWLTRGVNATGAKRSLLPKSPSDIGDDGTFQFVVLGPRAASSTGKPSAEAERYLNEHSDRDDPRIHRNAILVVAPDRGSLTTARDRVRERIAWYSVRDDLRQQDSHFEENDSNRFKKLQQEIKQAENAVPNSIRYAYRVVVTLNTSGEVQAFELKPGTDSSESLFSLIKKDPRARIQETAISADALMPGGLYDLWHPGDESMKVSDLIAEFSKNPRLQKLLRREAIYETLTFGCEKGTLVLRLPDAVDGDRTFWQQEVPPGQRENAKMEIVLPEQATLLSLAPELLKFPEKGELARLPDLWKSDSLAFAELQDYFRGNKEVMKSEILSGQVVPTPFLIPHVTDEALCKAVSDAVRAGYIWLRMGDATYYRSVVAPVTITKEACLLKPKEPLPAASLLPEALPSAWHNGITTVRQIAVAYAASLGNPLPVSYLRDVVRAAYQSSLIYVDEAIPTDETALFNLTLRLPELGGGGRGGTEPEPNTGGGRQTQAILKSVEIQDFAEVVGQLTQLATDHGITLTFKLSVELDEAHLSEEVLREMNALLERVSSRLHL